MCPEKSMGEAMSYSGGGGGRADNEARNKLKRCVANFGRQEKGSIESSDRSSQGLVWVCIRNQRDINGRNEQ